MSDANGANGHARPRHSKVEVEVLRLLRHPDCSAAFRGWLQLDGLREIQREARLVRPTGVPEAEPGRVAGEPPG